ncbi:MAG: hypothetical protein NTV11_12030 [Rhodocyclales bacterium]|nr:hypothetical protein [Rhodocyclales bacterium]
MFALAGIYGSFDAARVSDRSAGQAKAVLVMNTFATMSPDRKTRFSEALNGVAKNPKALGRLCAEVRKIGMPNYYPGYMILHGIKAFTGKLHDGALLEEFDSQKVWMNLQATYLHCPA